MYVCVVSLYVQDAHWDSCSALAAASSAAVQFAVRHAATAAW